MSLLIRTQSLHRWYGDQHAVRGIDLSLDRGEVLGLLGPNGAGKTSTLHMLTGNLAPSQGQIRVLGFDLARQPKRAKRHLGYLPETPPLYPDLTVDEYLRFAARLHGIRRNRLHRVITGTKERCGLDSTGPRLIGQLSKGFRQRVGIAQAIVHRPAVIVLDEPTVGLDPIQIREIRQLIRQLGEEHGVIFSSHILAEVQAVCTRVQILHEGRAVFTDRLERLADRTSASSLVARLRNPPDTFTLTTIPGVKGVEHISDNQYRLLCDPDHPPGEAIVIHSVKEGWGLQELYPERHSLEQVFLDLTLAGAEQPNPPIITDRRTRPR